MTYKQAISEQCIKYAKDPKARFIGYNVVYGSRMYGTLNEVPESQCIEMPVAENLMVGLAIGMALEGYLPVVCFERHDFLLLALDAIVNHVDKLPYLSGYQYKLPIIIRAIVGSKKPMNPGPQHNNDYTKMLDGILKHTPVWDLSEDYDVEAAWATAGETPSGAIVIVEHKDIYEAQLPTFLEKSDSSLPF